MPDNLDPYQIDSRTERQLDVVLHQLEEEALSAKDRSAIIQIVERTHSMIQSRREKAREPEQQVGSAVRKYQQSFAANAGRGRAVGSGGSDYRTSELGDDEPAE